MFPSLVLSGRDDHKVNLNSAAYDHLLLKTNEHIKKGTPWKPDLNLSVYENMLYKLEN